MTSYVLKDSINGILKKIYSHKGEGFAEIVINWGKIVGEEFKSNTSPVNIKYYKRNNITHKTLVISTIDKASILKLKFSEMIILERINNYLGYKAVDEIKIK